MVGGGSAPTENLLATYTTPPASAIYPIDHDFFYERCVHKGRKMIWNLVLSGVKVLKKA
jgi:hypothetical protein